MAERKSGRKEVWQEGGLAERKSGMKEAWHEKRMALKENKGLSAIWHFIKLAHQIHSGYIPLALISAVAGSITPFVNIIAARYIINELTGAKRMKWLVLYISILAVGNAVMGVTNSIIRKKLQISGEKLADGFELHVGNHIMHMDFEKLEDAKILDMKEKALFNIRLHDALLGGPRTIVDIVRLVIILIGVIGIIATYNPALVAILFLLTMVNAFIYRRIQATKFRFYQDIAVYNRQFAYFQELTQDFKNAKDVRIYKMSEYIISRINQQNHSVNKIFHEMFLKQRRHDGVSAVIIQAQTLAAYAFAAWGVLHGTLMVGDFAMYISAANQFSGAAMQLMTKLVDLQMLGNVLQDYIAFEQLPGVGSGGGRTSADVNSAKIEFKNVWFRYPGQEAYALKDISLTIGNGEKLSIVGRNGAGKTTFIKLLCRLYRPEKGCILFNGVDINEFEESEYSKLLSVIFQDYKIFSFSIRENLAFDKIAEEGRIRDSLGLAGILEKVDELALGIDTPLYKNFDQNGVELSGGEMQKIAIARALYRNAPLVVLDEPTASLDPYSEYEVYSQFILMNENICQPKGITSERIGSVEQKVADKCVHEYNRMTDCKTTVYISHRLSSCRFCDVIAVFDNGEIVEYGNHEQLVGNGKLYAEMWQAQAQYYQ